MNPRLSSLGQQNRANIIRGLELLSARHPERIMDNVSSASQEYGPNVFNRDIIKELLTYSQYIPEWLPERLRRTKMDIYELEALSILSNNLVFPSVQWIQAMEDAISDRDFEDGDIGNIIRVHDEVLDSINNFANLRRSIDRMEIEYSSITGDPYFRLRVNLISIEKINKIINQIREYYLQPDILRSFRERLEDIEANIRPELVGDLALISRDLETQVAEHLQNIYTFISQELSS